MHWRKFTVPVALAGILIACILAAAVGANKDVASVMSDARRVQPSSKLAACTMTYTDGVPASYWRDYQAGTGTYSYYDPAITCGSPAYPFQITDFSFVLYDNGGEFSWPVVVDVVVYAADGSPPDSCGGPGTELCRYTLTADQATYGYPAVGTFTLPAACCVQGPFFMGIEYTAGDTATNPSILFDDLFNPDSCIDWMLYSDGNLYEWYDFWDPDANNNRPGYPMFWVDGETQSLQCAQPCDWSPGDPHKMHYPQLPDTAGWDVIGTDPVILADDWRCTATGPVTDFHWWGSWRDGAVGVIQAFNLKVYSDIPADQSPLGYSMPGDLLWEYQTADFDVIPFDPTTPEGWYDPTVVPEDIRPNNHQQFFQYNVCIPAADAFNQDQGTIYWFSVSAILEDPQQTQWGWKSTRNHFNDDAVWASSTNPTWTDIWEPTPPRVNDFFVQYDGAGNFTSGGGSEAYGNGWYLYPSGWRNIWFYDHPFTYENKKTIHIEFDLSPTQVGIDQQLLLAVNWATDQWSLDQPAGDSMPPLPGTDEALYIGRAVLLDTAGAVIEGHFSYNFEIPDYNPEWVSIDVQGLNFTIQGGFIRHSCRPSLDLAFVVTGESPQTTGACCYVEPSSNQPLCTVTTQTDCEQNLGGTYLGDGTTCSAAQEACCLPDGLCLMADPLCCDLLFQGTPQGAGTQCTQPEACCLPDGSCQMLDPLCCDDLGGVPEGAGTQCSTVDRYCCLPDGTCELLDPLCCEDLGGSPLPPGVACTGQTVACCFADGSCQTVDEACCQALGGTPSPSGYTTCQGDANGNQIDDACESPRGACCYSNAAGTFCLETTEDSCQTVLLGTYTGDGTTCLGAQACCLSDGSCLTIDALCCELLGGVPQGQGTQCTQNEACCFQDGSCQNLDPVCCVSLGGTPQGVGTVCLGDANGNQIDDACEPQEVPGACCLEDGSCVLLLQADCIAAGGDFKGGGTVCGGDANNNGIDDICENWNPGDDHKMHFPQLPDETGWDVKSFAPSVVADDWQCSQTGPVSDIHFWGSWLHGIRGNILGFWISIHADIPASQSSTGYSMPGQLLWLEFFDNYNAIPIDTDTTEGWYDPTVPPVGIVVPNDHSQYFQYNIFVDSTRWFYQEQGTIYWLNISAVLEDTINTKWGWKSSIEHFNDDAVWGTDTSLCVVPDNGGGTADLPPDCPYTSPYGDKIVIVEGLPEGSTIECTPTIYGPFNIERTPGGSLGGEVLTYQATIQLEMHGTGALAGFNRLWPMDDDILQIATSPHSPGDPVQIIQTEIVQLDLTTMGDPDFALLSIKAGSDYGLPSPGHTTLTRLLDGSWNVDSFFDVFYQIEFQGALGSVLQDYGGTTQGNIRLKTGGEDVDGWIDLYEPPNFQQSMDMSFVITGGVNCDCIPGDADGNGIINISDAVYLVGYIFGGGPAPTPYPICSGDADCNCIVNISDAVYLISYIFGGGPAPCPCQRWLTNCGGPLR
jgi:hypothetical protein